MILQQIKSETACLYSSYMHSIWQIVCWFRKICELGSDNKNITKKKKKKNDIFFFNM